MANPWADAETSELFFLLQEGRERESDLRDRGIKVNNSCCLFFFLFFLFCEPFSHLSTEKMWKGIYMNTFRCLLGLIALQALWTTQEWTWHYSRCGDRPIWPQLSFVNHLLIRYLVSQCFNYRKRPKRWRALELQVKAFLVEEAHKILLQALHLLFSTFLSAL